MKNAPPNKAKFDKAILVPRSCRASQNAPSVGLSFTHMKIIQIPNACIYQSFERRQADSLDDSCPQETCKVGPNGTSPSAANDNQDSTKQVQMSFSPNSSRGDEDEAGSADCA